MTYTHYKAGATAELRRLAQKVVLHLGQRAWKLTDSDFGVLQREVLELVYEKILNGAGDGQDILVAGRKMADGFRSLVELAESQFNIGKKDLTVGVENNSAAPPVRKQNTKFRLQSRETAAKSWLGIYSSFAARVRLPQRATVWK